MIKRPLNARWGVSTAVTLSVFASLAVTSEAVAQSTPSASWSQVASLGPAARGGASLVYDSARSRTVLFGGDTGFGNYQADTWEFDGTAWHQVQVSGPQARYLAPMVFDSARQVTVLFGGYGYPGYLTDTWEWDGAAWSRRFTAHNPPARDWSAMTYDSRRHVAVLFGGLGGDGGLLNDTWEYDGTDWSQVATQHAPAARRGMSLAFDPIRGATVMFGGQSAVNLNDTWEYDGSDWTQVSLPTAPSPRMWQAMAYDAALGGEVVFGGYQSGLPLEDTWLYDGSAWQQVASSSRPSDRFWSGVVFDSANSRLLLFGGAQDTNSQFSFGDTWSLAGANTLPVDWSRPASSGPSPRVWPAMDYDSSRGVTVLFGGSTGGSGAFNDTWEWDGFTWVQRPVSGGPPALAGAAMAFDSRRKVSVLFGGVDPSGASTTATWEWNGSAWTQRSLAASPPARVFAAMAYDSTRGRIVLFGGSSATGRLSDTWEFDGMTWTQANPPASPSARMSAAMAFDSARGRTVLFGGSDANGGRQADTWEWNGAAWTQIATATAPYARFWSSMAFDPVRGKAVLFGGDHIQPYSLGPTNDTWDWDGTSWTRDWTGSAPPVRAGQAMAFDVRRDRMVMFGGFNAAVSPNVLYGDTWELASGTVSAAGNPAATLTPSSLGFGSVPNGTTSPSSPVFVASSGTGPLVFTLSTSGDFAISSTDCPSAPSPLAAGSSCIVFVNFTPTAAGDRSGSLDMTGNMTAGSQSVALAGTGLQADFTISANPTSLSMIQGGPNPTSAISTTAIGAVGTVVLSGQTNDPGVSASFSPASIAAGTSSTMTVLAGPSVGPGFYGVRVFGTEGAASHYVDVTLQVLPVPDFSIAATPDSITVTQGGSTSVGVTTTQIGPASSVNLAASVTPAGPTATLASPWVSAGGSTTLTVSAGYGVVPGAYTVTVTGTEGSRTHSTTIALNVTLKGIDNGGFESGDLTGWTSSGVTSVVAVPHSGGYSGRVGSTSASATSTLSQTFTVPASGGKLTFWYYMSCAGKIKSDWFSATVQDGVTGAVTTIVSPTCLRRGPWTKVTVSLSSHAGHYVTVAFLNHDDGAPATPTYTLIDDVTFS